MCNNNLACPAAEDYRLFAERELPCELRSDTGNVTNEAGSVEALRVRILVRGVQPELESVRVRLANCTLLCTSMYCSRHTFRLC